MRALFVTSLLFSFCALGPILAGCGKPPVRESGAKTSEEPGARKGGSARPVPAGESDTAGPLLLALAYNPDLPPDSRSKRTVVTPAGRESIVMLAVSNSGAHPAINVAARLHSIGGAARGVTVVAAEAEARRLEPGATGFLRLAVRLAAELPPGKRSLLLTCKYLAAGRAHLLERNLVLRIPAYAVVAIRPSGGVPARVKSAPLGGAPYATESWRRGVNPPRAAAVLGYHLVAGPDDRQELEVDVEASSRKVASNFIPRLLWSPGRGVEVEQVAVRPVSARRRRLILRVATRRAERGVHALAITAVHRIADWLELDRTQLGLGIYGATGDHRLDEKRELGDFTLKLTTPEGAVLTSQRHAAAVPDGPDDPSPARRRTYIERDAVEVVGGYLHGAEVRLERTPELDETLSSRRGAEDLGRFTVRRLAGFYAGRIEGHRLYATLGRKTVTGKVAHPVDSEDYHARLARVAALSAAQALQGVLTQQRFALRARPKPLRIGKSEVPQLTVAMVAADARPTRQIPIRPVKVWSARKGETYEGKDLAGSMPCAAGPIHVRYDLAELRRSSSLRGALRLSLLARSDEGVRTQVKEFGGDLAEFHLAGLGKGSWRISLLYDGGKPDRTGTSGVLRLVVSGGEGLSESRALDDPLALLSDAERRGYATGGRLATAISMRRFRGVGEASSRYVFGSRTHLDRKEVSQRLVTARYDRAANLTRFQVALTARTKKKWLVEWIPQEVRAVPEEHRRYRRHPARLARLEVGTEPMLASFEIRGKLGRDFHDLKTKVSGSPPTTGAAIALVVTFDRGLMAPDPLDAARQLGNDVDALARATDTFGLVDLREFVRAEGTGDLGVCYRAEVPFRPARLVANTLMQTATSAMQAGHVEGLIAGGGPGLLRFTCNDHTAKVARRGEAIPSAFFNTVDHARDETIEERLAWWNRRRLADPGFSRRFPFPFRFFNQLLEYARSGDRAGSPGLIARLVERDAILSGAGSTAVVARDGLRIEFKDARARLHFDLSRHVDSGHAAFRRSAAAPVALVSRFEFDGVHPRARLGAEGVMVDGERLALANGRLGEFPVHVATERRAGRLVALLILCVKGADLARIRRFTAVVAGTAGVAAASFRMYGLPGRCDRPGAELVPDPVELPTSTFTGEKMHEKVVQEGRRVGLWTPDEIRLRANAAVELILERKRAEDRRGR